jgi:hypothetical protein
MQLAVSYLQCRRRAASDFRIKLKRKVTPGAPHTLALCLDAVRRRLAFVYRAGDLIASEGRGLLAGS